MSVLSKKRLGAVVASVAVVLSASLLAAPANAAGRTPVNIIGTSDVSDSNLISAVIKPGFEYAYPQYQLNYTGKATGAAITGAETGAYDGLIVHAASLENQFVAPGGGKPSYSAEPYGRAIFWGDFVLAGTPDSTTGADPAGILTGGSPSHDIVRAFERVAAAGVAGTASFISRGGTPGTTVSEHAIWALVHQDQITNPPANPTDLITMCTVPAGDGGGMTPSTTTGDCPTVANGGAVPPSWYYTTGATQGPNVVDADQCNTATFTQGGCYVFTDRGTFEYLQSEVPAAISHLQIVTRDNTATAPGGITALVNSFHGYVVNPAAFASGQGPKDTAGATALLNWITSPAGQQAIGNYLSNAGGAAFLPDARPTLTASKLPSSVTTGKKITVTGTIANVVPGTPALSGVKVSLLATPTGLPGVATAVASATTNAQGAYSISYVPKRNDTYTVSSPAIEKIEDGSLSPVFGDLLQPQTVPLSAVKVGSKVTLKKPKVKGTKVTLKGTFSPAAPAGAQITLLKAKGSKKPKASGLSTLSLKTGAKRFSFSVKLPKGKWKIKVKYSDPTGFTTSTSTVKKVKVK